MYIFIDCMTNISYSASTTKMLMTDNTFKSFASEKNYAYF